MPKEKKLWWVYHNDCPVTWQAGPFESKKAAEDFRDNKLMSGPHCPGCDEEINPNDPARGSYEIR
ncbi:hypothetical protein IIA15_01335 [candidate division TA06 bacterium]|nr:hypothetical protein [candidate division TA06 bacterium]